MILEEIGRIKLDLTHYPGEDLYCDGAVEDEILEIVKNYSQVEYQGIIEERASWPILYHLSPLRENIVDWIPMNPNAKVLEVGSGCGAITGALSKKAGQVTCVDLSKKRSMINAYRHAECENVVIHVGNFKDIEPDLPNDYDYICLIGVFEYGQSYMGTDTPFEDFLNMLKKHLAPNGRIAIAIENKLGMKYFAGCKEDHLGTYFSGIENYAEGGGVRTFSRRGLEKIFQTCQMKKYSFYYPYPDYKFMTTLYSDAYLPGKGELSNNLRNFDRDRMLLFDEKNAFDGIVEDGLFSVFANSFMAILGEGFDLKYVKYSNDRAPEYRIKTQIARSTEGTIKVEKHPLSNEAREHVHGMGVAYESLKRRYAGGELLINHCDMVEGEDSIYAAFEYIDGKPLSELLDQCLNKNDMEGFHTLFSKYVDLIGYHQEYPVADFDMVFGNIMVKGDQWTLIDYEWTFGKEVETKELAFRAIYCYLLEDEKRNKLNLDMIFGCLGINEKDAEYYREQEMNFQKFVTGKSRAMAEMRELIGYRLLQPVKWVARYRDDESALRVQVYEDKGAGFGEEQSYFVADAYQGEQLLETTLAVDGNVEILRIDPAMDSCIIKIEELLWNGEQIPLSNKKLVYVNGKMLKATGSAIFPTKDPNLYIHVASLERKPENMLYARIQVVRIPEAMAQDMAGAVKRVL